MKPLPTTFRKGGFDYTQLVREGLVAIYRQTKAGQSWEAFEVGRIRQNQARHQFGKEIDASESWPSSNDWGRLAWTYTDLRRAKARFCALIPPDNKTP